MRRIIQMIGCILVSVALLIAQMAFAESAVPAPTDDFWFLDEANVLSDATEGEIFFSNQRMADVSASEIVVVAVNSTGNYTIDDYANNLYNQWEINVEGVLMLLAIQDDDYYVLPGAVLGQSLHSSEIQELLNTYLEPDFAAKNYDSGVKKAFEALYARVAELNHLSVKVQDGINDYEAFIAGEIAEVGGTTGSNAVAGSTQSVDWVPEQNIRQEREGG
ncbi:MAG: TPM domain-containing protein [Clostridia bacterium]|nr:TPM domain-containing protein [Clostridia bacterium]